MKDLTSTSLGLLIATLLPGLSGFYGLSLWSPRVECILKISLKSQQSVGLFLLVIFAALTIGLIVSAPRWFLYEKCLLKRYKFEPEGFSSLREKDRLEAFRAVVDEHYRYHQFFGGMSIVAPILLGGWIKCAWSSISCRWVLFSIVLTVSIEVILILGAIDSFKKYVDRGSAIMKGVER